MPRGILTPIGHRRCIADECFDRSFFLKPSAIPGKHRNDRESRTWFYFPDAVAMLPMHRRRRNKSVSINNICLRTISDA